MRSSIGKGDVNFSQQNLQKKQNINGIGNIIKEHSKTQKKMSSMLKDHELKLNTTSTFLATSRHTLASNTDTYSI